MADIKLITEGWYNKSTNTSVSSEAITDRQTDKIIIEKKVRLAPKPFGRADEWTGRRMDGQTDICNSI